MIKIVDRTILAHIKECPAHDEVLAGSMCTVDCKHRYNCSKRKIKLVIPNIVLEVNCEKIENREYKGIPTLSIPTNNIYTDEYLNKIIEL